MLDQQAYHTEFSSSSANNMIATGSPGVRHVDKQSHSDADASMKLVEAERKIRHYKILLRIAGDKLEETVRGVNEAAARATFAESCTGDALVKVARAETTHHHSEMQRLQINQELDKYRNLSEDAERKLRRIQQEVGRLEQENQELRSSVEEVKDSKRRYAQAFRDLQVQQDGKEESNFLNMERCYIEGREDGWNEGRCDGYEEGRRDGYNDGLKKGRKEGFSEGRERGREEEREKALEAFDRFLEEDMENSKRERDEQTREWAELVHAS
ncbi:hypothetical protein AX17_004562 [Amanita inopinata Kibby_2008]|nr:hypothetical protein AX17_004562 [Amanita inopinata Kibby_2008]